jgi:prolipoprotein diacylglyceryl transferase
MNSHFIWSASPELFSANGFTIRWYGFLFAIGFYLGLKVLNGIARQEKLEPSEMDGMLIYIILGTVIGARLGHVFFYEPDLFLADPIRIFKVWEGGLASHGGTLGVITGVLLWKRKYYRGSLLSLLDFVAVPGALVSGLIRVGNFFNSEILGKPSDLPWAIVFKRVDETPRHPAMLYESFCYFSIFALLYGLTRKKIHRRFNEGFLLGLFFILIYGSRILIEFFKEPQVASEAGLPFDLGQILSVPFVAAGGFLLIRSISSRKKA